MRCSLRGSPIPHPQKYPRTARPNRDAWWLLSDTGGANSRMKTIVLGLDGVSEADRALERAATIAEAFRSTLIVVVVEPIPAVPLAGITDTAIASAAIPEQTWSRELLIEQARSSLGAR